MSNINLALLFCSGVYVTERPCFRLLLWICCLRRNYQRKWNDHRMSQSKDMDRKLEFTMSYAEACQEVRRDADQKRLCDRYT